MTEILAWHFLPGNKKTRFNNLDVKLGETLKVDPDRLNPRNYGLHACKKALDALRYVDFDNAIACKVKLSGKIIEEGDKLCASERTVVAWAPCDKVLHEFAVWCAEDVLPIFEKEYPDDKRPRQAIEAKKKWLNGEITDKELEKARAEAGEAWEAGAARAAWAAWAARQAAGAASDAAWAAWAAWAARQAAWDRQNKKLEDMLLEILEDKDDR